VKVLEILVIAFVVGGFPWCWLAVWLFGARDKNGERQDLRKIGTGNVGASNAMEFVGVGWYLPLIAIDASKSISAIVIARKLEMPLEIVSTCAFIAVLGHCYPIWLGFKRGKGVSCALGVLTAFGLWYPIMSWSLLIFLVTTGLSRRPSLGILIATATMLAMAIFEAQHSLMIGMITALVWFQFRANILRLLQGKEPPYLKGRKTQT